MFQTIIVGVDDPADAANTIAFARAIAPTGELLLTSVYGFDDLRGEASLPGYGEAARADRTAALETLQREVAGINSRIVVIPDISPGHGLKILAGERNADLVVLGSARHTWLGGMALGEVSRAVLRGAPCPVAVVPREHRTTELHEIGVAFDRSAAAFVALDTAAELASTTGAILELHAVVDAIMTPEVGGPQHATAVEDLRTGVEVDLRAIAAGLSVPATAYAEVGRVRPVLSKLAARVDLLVTGSRAWGPVARVTLGSTSDWLIHHVGCPVLVVPRPAEEAARAVAPRATAEEHAV